ncbi:CPBP family intramembrane metalloprotease [Candidatus Micrarchaeota archaeon]|nr:CPBP family intramembrane metalloprotease [Candidatus Micrarchaeota archaeon]
MRKMRLFREKMKLFFSFLLFLSAALFTLALFCGSFQDISWCKFITENYIYFGAGTIHVGLFSAAMIFLWKKDLKTTLDGLSFPGDVLRNLVMSVNGFVLVICTLLVLGIVAALVGFADQSAVYEKVAELPVYILAFAVVFAPVSEELFFRAFLVDRVGVVLSSLLFGLMHFAYGSAVEIIGAALIGVVLAFIYKASKSITPCLVIHLTYNLMSIAVMRLVL